MVQLYGYQTITAFKLKLFRIANVNIIYEKCKRMIHF